MKIKIFLSNFLDFLWNVKLLSPTQNPEFLFAILIETKLIEIEDT